MVKIKDSKELMKKISYKFRNEEYLKEALTHRSYSNENNRDKQFDNEKLEFLGDAVVNLIVTEYIYNLGEGKKEGELAKLKSQIISEPVFSSIASDLKLGNYLYLSNGEIMSGGRNRKSILGDAFEALIGAIFKDSDYYTTKEIAMKYLMEKIENINDIEGTGDYKTILQELLQGEYRKMPEYELIRTAGPDHDKIFEISVKLNDKIIGNGSGKSKKEAEKNAAKEALKFVENKIKNKK
ncbi:MAG: ribonuclease III [Leptotrichiaceae bacterium]|nr:ribonuclease III [Leptotrichiaceae bacterium]MBP6280914.1 ribonuclease III [Leptotrichiaceae bacterium]MBP7100603.1 ribonuclease III [Leptotrichiaceae bacterium]MBP7739367.1 ribonuclease III [Leptotrichiaceae bacterium]MBP9629355.1 ribonuclease III [Leptotrichiaceae bacterium]